jgi:iron complex transport system substrate-binding protein
MDGGEPRIAAIERDFSEVRSRTARSSRPRVWCEEWGKPIIASQTCVAELVEAAGGDFVGAGQHAAAGEVQRLDPELIIAAWCGAGPRPARDDHSGAGLAADRRGILRPYLLRSR